jgi:hypothetical protein
VSDSLHCPQCGAVVPADSGGGLCPQCLLRMALETESLAINNPTDEAPEENAHRQFGPYKTIRLLGRGGWARCTWQSSSNHSVAL